MREDMEPSVTMKSLVPLLFTPVMVFTRAADVATMERPGSMITVKPISLAWSRIVSNSSLHKRHRTHHVAPSTPVALSNNHEQSHAVGPVTSHSIAAKQECDQLASVLDV